jgi:hypothetical protein
VSVSALQSNTVRASHHNRWEQSPQTVVPPKATPNPARKNPIAGIRGPRSALFPVAVARELVVPVALFDVYQQRKRVEKKGILTVVDMFVPVRVIPLLIVDTVVHEEVVGAE